MKSYWDLTPAERLSLTDEQLDNVWIPREAAMQGLLCPAKPILIELPEKPAVSEPSSIPAFKVKGIKGNHSYEFNCCFPTLQEAQDFIALKPSGTDSSYGAGYTRRYHQKYFTSYEVELVNLTDQDEWDAYDEAMKAYDEVKDSNDKQTSNYNSKLAAIENSAKSLRNNLQRLRERRASMLSVIETLDEFIKVAEGDFIMACRFLLKKTDRQLVYDALQEYSHTKSYPAWNTIDIFGAECLLEDLNPYRGLEDNKRLM